MNYLILIGFLLGAGSLNLANASVDNNVVMEALYGKLPDSQQKITEWLQSGVNVNAKITIQNPEDEGESISVHPLIAASTALNLSAVELLVQSGADVNIKDEQGKTPLMYLLNKTENLPNLEVVKLLIQSGADVNDRDNDGGTPLLYASKNTLVDSGLEAIKLLIQSGADVNIAVRDKNGDQAFPLAVVFYFSVLVIGQDLDDGKDLNEVVEYKYKKTGVHIKITLNQMIENFYRAVQLLIEAGANPSVSLQGSGLGSPLIAITLPKPFPFQFEIVKLLVEAGANIHTKDENNRTALYYAKTLKRNNIAEYLESLGAYCTGVGDFFSTIECN